MKKSLFFFVVFVIIPVAFLTAQDKKTRAKQRFEDAFREADSDVLTLRFFNAVDGKPIEGAEVTVGESEIFVSDHMGRIFLDKTDEMDARHTVTFSHSHFVRSKFDIEIMAGTLFFNRFSISPRIPLGALRVVLDWDDSPGDLDAHLIKEGDYHISYRNKRVADDGAAQLDRDDTNGHGPETITANRVDENAVYSFFVHDFTNRGNDSSKALSKSKGHVMVFGNNRLLHVFRIPRGRAGTNWHVFEIRNGDIMPVNRIGQ
ncbi:MAG: hypothetical protein DWQ05_22265 [Calditrichaeota bacterium]|nr:MAG: hypothetical protein DWQ05_22265 [Calditrichota bacterium]